MYAKYARTARKTLQKMLTIKEITSIIMHHLPSIQIEDCGSRNKPPTVSGMPSVFYYITLREKCQTLIRLQIAKKASPQQHISKKRACLTVCSLFLFQRQYRTKSCGFPTHSPPHHAAGNVSVISVPCSGSLLTESVAW